MIANKHITKIVAVIMAIAVCLCLCAMVFSEQLVSALGGTGVTMEYETKLFNTDEIISVNIIMDADDWADMLENATAEQYYQCDIEIGGDTFYRVGIRPKGNTSLSQIASDPDNDRYSLKLEFDQYVEGQTCYGLDKLILNNNFADATNMKEAMIYDMFGYIGADASLYNYANISVNGEYWGVYLALEAVEDSFMLRNYGTENGELYKPDSMDMGGANRDNGGDRDFGNMTPPAMGENGSFDPSQFGGEMLDNADPSQFGNMTPSVNDSAEAETDNNTDTSKGRQNADTRPDMGGNMGGGKGGFGMGGNGSNLNYSDDELDSYSTIWDCEVTNTSESDHKRVVTALKNISQGTNLENYMDIDNLLKYAAVHIFSVNTDSLSGSMSHNYYLYENDGKLNLLPWDYNLALGGMGGMGGSRDSSSGATSTVNDAIDNAFSGTTFFDTLLADEEYHTQYYAYMQQLVDEYILGDGFQIFYNRTRSFIDELVKADPNALYTYEEYATALETLCEVVELRGQSIEGQLNGTIPSTESEQKNSDSLIDASHLDLSVMGSMNMGGGRGDFVENRNNRESQNNFPNINNDNQDTTGITGISSVAEEKTDETATPPQAGGQMPEGFDPSQFSGEMPGDFDPSQFAGQMPGNPQSENKDTGNSEQTQGGFNFPGRNETANQSTAAATFVTYGISFALLIAAIVFAVLYKRKPRKR